MRRRLMALSRAGGPVTASAIAITLAVGAQQGSAQLPKETPQDIVATQIRSQGYECKEPKRAARDAKASKPDEPVWILDCENQSYRVRLIPGQAARVERLGSS